MGASRTWLGRQWRQGLAEREISWKQSLARKWGTSDVAVPDTRGRGVGLPLLQIAGEERGWSRVGTAKVDRKINRSVESEFAIRGNALAT